MNKITRISIILLLTIFSYFIFIYDSIDSKKDNVAISYNVEEIILTEMDIIEDKITLDIILEPVYERLDKSKIASIKGNIRKESDTSFLYDLKQGKPYVVQALNDLLSLHLNTSLEESISGDNQYEAYIELRKDNLLLFESAEIISFILESKKVFTEQDIISNDPDRIPLEDRLLKAEYIYEEMLYYSLLTTSTDDFFDHYNQTYYDF